MKPSSRPLSFSAASSSSSSSLNLNFLTLCNTRTITGSGSRVFLHKPNNTALLHRLHRSSVYLRAGNEANRTIISIDEGSERSEADKIVDSMDFGELCNEFECISSPSVESTARQLLRDILELRKENRAIGVLAISIKYKDPVRSFTGRDKYKRQIWATDALQKPSVSVQQMVMLSTSVLNIKWTLRGKLKPPVISIGRDLIIKVNSTFTLNQISGQVIEHEESWDISASPLQAQAYFWTSRWLFATIEAGRDASDLIKDFGKRVSSDNNKNVEMYPDITSDPTKFFQRDDSELRDLYQIALFIAVAYFVIQFLRTTL